MKLKSPPGNRLILVLVLMLMFTLTGIIATAGEKKSTQKDKTQQLKLGTSGYTIEISSSFQEGEMTEADLEEEQVAYMKSPDTLLDFDIYQHSKDNYPDDLADYAVKKAQGYQSIDALVTDTDINGVKAAYYHATEKYEDTTYTTLTYILDEVNSYIEIVFWLDGDSAEEEAEAIIQTLKIEE